MHKQVGRISKFISRNCARSIRPYRAIRLSS